MTGGSRPPGTPEMLGGRLALHWGCRIAGRAWMLVHPAGALHHRGGLPLAIGLTALDALQARLLQRGWFDTPWGAVVRAALDALDAAVVTGFAPPRSFKWSSGGGVQVPGASAAVMTAYRTGALPALAAIAPSTVAVGAARAARGRPVELADLVTWPAWDLALGSGFAAVERSQIRRRSAREGERRVAAGEQAFLAGRRAWIRADGHLRLLDQLEGFGLALHDMPGVDLSDARELDVRGKIDRIVAAPESGQHAYLAALLRQFEERRRRETHLVADRLTLAELPAGYGELLLNPHQTRRLWDALTVLGVAGHLRLQVLEQISRGLDVELLLRVTSTRTLDNGPPVAVTMKLETGTPTWRVEFVTLGLVLAGAHDLTLTRPAPGQVPLPIGLSAVAVSCVAAALAEWRVRRRGSQAAPAAALVGFGPALFIAVRGTRRMRSAYTEEGVAIYPGVWAFTGIGYLLGFYASRMTLSQKGVLAAGVASQLGASWLSSVRPRSKLAFAGELIWVSAAMVGGFLLSGLLDRVTARVAAENEQQTTDHAHEQWLAGWAFQQHKALAMHDLGRRILNQARPENDRQRSKLRDAHAEHRRQATGLRRAAAHQLPGEWLSSPQSGGT